MRARRRPSSVGDTRRSSTRWWRTWWKRLWLRWSKSGNVAIARPERRRQICPMSDSEPWRPSTSTHLPMPQLQFGSAYASLRGWSTAAAYGDTTMIGVGIVGCNYGRTVLIPAFRQDPRCEGVALAGTDTARTAGFAPAPNVPRGLARWPGIGPKPPPPPPPPPLPPLLHPP